MSLASDHSYLYELRRLAAKPLIEIGSHTGTHFDCRSTEDMLQLESEIAGSKRESESAIEQPIRFFAFPWGRPIAATRGACCGMEDRVTRPPSWRPAVSITRGPTPNLCCSSGCRPRMESPGTLALFARRMPGLQRACSDSRQTTTRRKPNDRTGHRPPSRAIVAARVTSCGHDVYSTFRVILPNRTLRPESIGGEKRYSR